MSQLETWMFSILMYFKMQFIPVMAKLPVFSAIFITEVQTKFRFLKTFV